MYFGHKLHSAKVDVIFGIDKRGVKSVPCPNGARFRRMQQFYS
jgi:hypothetical protein